MHQNPIKPPPEGGCHVWLVDVCGLENAFFIWFLADSCAALEVPGSGELVGRGRFGLFLQCWYA
jgi:hypothetical protein